MVSCLTQIKVPLTNISFLIGVRFYKKTNCYIKERSQEEKKKNTTTTTTARIIKKRLQEEKHTHTHTHTHNNNNNNNNKNNKWETRELSNIENHIWERERICSQNQGSLSLDFRPLITTECLWYSKFHKRNDKPIMIHFHHNA